MGKNKNYRKMYTPVESDVTDQTSIVDMEQEPVVEEPTETIVCPEKCEFIPGTVVDCTKLNVREHPNATADVKFVIAGGSEVQVCTAHNYEDWYEVCTASGVEGYCMKQYISVKQ